MLFSSPMHVGFTVTKKNVRKAVDRNRVKRLIRAGLSRYISQNRLKDNHSTYGLFEKVSSSKSINKKRAIKGENEVQDNLVSNRQNVEDYDNHYAKKSILRSVENDLDTISLVNIVYARKSDSVSTLSLNEVHSDIEHFFTKNSKDFLPKCN